jgi:endo-1,3-1,4-beta-glycanase ExoK
MARLGIQSLLILIVTLTSAIAHAVSSAEVYTSAPYGYGRFEARIRFAAGDGVVSSFFLWKDGSEVSGTFWNELDFEKLEDDCHVETNAIFGNPPSNNNEIAAISGDPCGGYHVYAYEWTPDAIVWLVDGVEVRRSTGAIATAFADNASSAGMQLRFNVWPGDESFGGNFNPNILPVHEYVDWVQFSSYANGQFTLAWREDFDSGALPAGWLTANWSSPKNLSTHAPGNVNFIDGYLVLSLTADNAIGPNGAMPQEPGAGGAGGSGGAGMSGSGGVAGSQSGGAGSGGAGSGGAGSGGEPSSGGAGATSAGGTSGAAGSGATSGGAGAGATGGVAGAGATSGASGAASGATGGVAAGGVSGVGAGPSAGGAAGSGVSGAGAANNVGGSAGSAGSSVSTPDGDAENGGGCGCSTSGAGPRRALWSVLALASLAVLRRRARRAGSSV